MTINSLKVAAHIRKQIFGPSYVFKLVKKHYCQLSLCIFMTIYEV